jgi:hypothetical protein
MDAAITGAIIGGGAILVAAVVPALTTRRTRQDVKRVHEAVATSNGQTAGQYVEETAKRLTTLAEHVDAHIVSDKVAFGEIKETLRVQDRLADVIAAALKLREAGVDSSLMKQQSIVAEAVHAREVEVDNGQGKGSGQSV